MKSTILKLSALAVLASTVACCGMFQSKEDRYKKEMECALRVTDLKSIEILKKGMFCCEALPAGVSTMPEARRFYLLRAMALNPSSPDPCAAIAKSYWDEGSYAKGLTYFEEMEKRSPKPLAAVIGEITMYRLMGQFDKALARLDWIRGQKSIDAEKVAAYLEGRILYDEGKYQEAEPLFKKALERANAGSDSLGDTPYTMKDAELYVALIRLKAGDTQGAYGHFKLFLKSMGDPDFQIYYAYWLPRIGSDQKAFYEKIEKEWTHVRQ